MPPSGEREGMPGGPPTPRQAARRPGRALRRALRPDEGAVGDFVGTILMVALVVALGAVVAVMVAAGLDDAAPPAASLSLAPVEPGDASLRVLLRNGAPIPVSSLALTLERNGTLAALPPSAWSVPGGATWRAGERLSIPLSPPAGVDEPLRVRVFRTDHNALLSELGARAGHGPASAPLPTLSGAFTPPSATPDGVATVLLEVRVSHPQGALAAASAVADLGALSRSAGAGPLLVPLSDSGRGGDAAGGDGVWSALVTVPRATPPADYAVPVNVTDAWGRATGAVLALNVKPGTAAAKTYVGLNFEAPTSQNVTWFRVRNWTWDQLYPQRVDDDFVTVRVVGDGGRGWTAMIHLDEVNGVPAAKQLRAWGPQNETVYVPRNGTRLPLANLDLDLLDPVGSLQWVYSTGAPHPTALYQHAGIQGRPRFTMPHFGQDQTTGNEPLSLGTGIWSAEVGML